MRTPSPGMLDVDVHPELRFLLRPARRGAPPVVPLDPDLTLGHVVETLGVPLTEVGFLLLDGAARPPSSRLDTPGRLEVLPVRRPQPAPTAPPRFLLDVHLGSLARRMWLLGLDTTYSNAADDDELVAAAAAERRVLLTQDRGLLRRRALPAGAYVRGRSTGDQLDDVLDRFAPDLDPWTRCGACGAPLEPVAPEVVAHLLEPGTRRTHQEFSRCIRCGRPYWRGAHARRLEDVVVHARGVVSARRVISARLRDGGR